MFENMFEKALKIEKGPQWSIPDKKRSTKMLYKLRKPMPED